MDPEIKVAIAVPDEEYHRLKNHTKHLPGKEYACKDKSGVDHVFYFQNRTFMGRKLVNEKWEEFEVMPMTEALKKKQEMEQRDPFRQHIREKMKNDNPSWTEEKLEANVDIVVEANETIKRLIAGGVSPDVAHKLITGILHSDEVKEHILTELAKQDKKD